MGMVSQMLSLQVPKKPFIFLFIRVGQVVVPDFNLTVNRLLILVDIKAFHQGGIRLKQVVGRLTDEFLDSNSRFTHCFLDPDVLCNELV